MPANSASVKVMSFLVQNLTTPKYQPGQISLFSHQLYNVQPSQNINASLFGELLQATITTTQWQVSRRNFHKATPNLTLSCASEWPFSLRTFTISRLCGVQIMASSCFHTSSKREPCTLARNKRKARVHVWAHFVAKRGYEKIKV